MKVHFLTTFNIHKKKEHLYSRLRSNTTDACRGSISFVFDARHVNTEPKSWRLTDGQCNLFSITFIELCSHSSSTTWLFFSHTTDGGGFPKKNHNGSRVELHVFLGMSYIIVNILLITTIPSFVKFYIFLYI